jgi:2-polyprenyl-3-methyl-5-hydroxy-6-metoxy-1,4-benzoquinol methylase
VAQSEEEFYENLFVKNESWNKATPNLDEQKRWEIIQYFIEKLKLNKDSNILDLGCGRGWLTNLLYSYGKVTGIEPVEKVLKHANRLFPHIHFVEGKASSLLKEFTGKFDLIVSSEVIEHVHDDEKQSFIEEIKVLLKDKGYVIISTPRKEAQKEWLQLNSAAQPIEEWISEEELKQLFEKSGFKLLDLKRIPRKPKQQSELIDLYQVCLFQKRL